MNQNKKPEIDPAADENSEYDTDPSEISRENMALKISDIGTGDSHMGKDTVVTLCMPFPLIGWKLSTDGGVY